jgi:hypothetical protein
MAESKTRRRGHGEDAIYCDTAKNRYAGAISLGFGPEGKRLRRKVHGRTKQEVRDKLRALHADLDRGPRTSPTYTVRLPVDDRILHEALATGADPLHLALVFGIDHTNAMAYANAARNLLSDPGDSVREM